MTDGNTKWGLDKMVEVKPQPPMLGVCCGVVAELDDEREFHITGAIQSVKVIKGAKAGPDYGAYAIVVTTDQGTWTIAGCHDMGPELLESRRADHD